MAQILGIEPKVVIPKPIGARITIAVVTTTLTAEEQWERAGLKLVVAEKSRPRNTLGIVVKLSQDPLIEENFKLGQGVYFQALSGVEIVFEGKAFRTLEFGEVINTIEEEEIPEAYKIQIRHFLLSPIENAEA